jgi:lipopolysaccharide/colanic/teichoic acid biosynthesis glycosyltransferase
MQTTPLSSRSSLAAPVETGTPEITRINPSKSCDRSMKRAFDIIGSAVGLMLLSPLLLWVAWRIRREDGGPVFYRGERVGRQGEPFRIFKFRTMVVNADKIGGTSTGADDPRITQIGKVLRRYKLDELPQLINVITGDMSLVGPRPQVSWAVALYTPEQQRVLSVRPGITDFASIIFKNEGEILKGSPDPDTEYLAKIHPEKMRLAADYVDHQSFILDLKIILKTLAALFHG